MKTSHALEVTAHPYSLGSPRVYFAKDYGVGDTVVNSDIVWVVKEFSGVLLFVSYEEDEEEMIRMAKSDSTSLKTSTKTVKEDGKIVGYLPVLKYKSFGGKDKVLWTGTEICMWRTLGPNSAETAARYKITELKKV